MPINKELIEKRQEVKKNKHDFVRPESWRSVRLQTNWRQPKGIDHHQRRKKRRGKKNRKEDGEEEGRRKEGRRPKERRKT